MAKVKVRPRYQTIEGIICPPFSPQRFREALNYEPTADDIFIDTYPKCGTTWMQNVVLYIFRRGKELENPLDFHRLCPFIDLKGLEDIMEMPRPGAFKTHLPYTHVPYSPEAKYIYVLRNPKDTCVSMYYHTKRSDAPNYARASFDDFFEIFMTGEVQYNDYFDHLSSWYPHRNDKHVFFTTYEDMKKDLKDIVVRVAAFLGEEHVEDIRKDNNVLNNILNFCSFEYMKKNLSEAFSGPRKQRDEESASVKKEEDETMEQLPEKPQFIRKGVVGDWVHHFSEEQSERLNRKFEERTRGTEIFEMYKDYLGI